MSTTRNMKQQAIKNYKNCKNEQRVSELEQVNDMNQEIIENLEIMLWNETLQGARRIIYLEDQVECWKRSFYNVTKSKIKKTIKKSS